MNEQIGPLLVVLLIGLAGGCVVFRLAAYDRALRKKQMDYERLGEILKTTGKRILLTLGAVCIVSWVFY